MIKSPDTAEPSRIRFWERTFTRRTILKVPAKIAPPLLAVGAYTAVHSWEKATDFAEQRAINPLSDQLDAYNKAKASEEDFLKENERLKEINIGCSFSPEKFFEIQGHEDHPKALKALKYIVEELHVKDIRLGIRWSNVIDKQGKFNFDFYKQYLDYCLNNGVNVCLNVGPIKTFRWPEIHLPKEVYETAGKLLPKKYEIKPTDPIAEKAFSYLNTLLFHIKTHYTPKQLENIKSIQAENEPFYPFGNLEWTSSPAYLKEVIRAIRFHFPDKNILVNSAGTLDLKRIDDFFNELAEEGIVPLNELIVGFDYYNRIEDVSVKIEETIKRVLDKIKFLSKYKDKITEKGTNAVDWIDIISASKMAPKQFGDINILKKLWELGVKKEVTEAQAEKWGRHISSGNSLADLMFVILRCLKEILDPQPDSKEKSVLRIWGIENLVWLHLFGKPSQEQEKMLNLMRAINLLN